MLTKSLNTVLIMCACLSLSSCLTKTVTHREPVFPPVEYLEYCKSDYGGRTLGEINKELDRIVNCERAGKKAIIDWRDDQLNGEVE